MTFDLVGKNIAILVANGFDENQVTEIQRALVKVKANIRTIAPEQGVVNGWQGAGWGHYFPVDAQIGEALGSDFDILILPGGERGVAKLKANPHARRIIGHFLDAGKPIAAIAAGVGLLAVTNKLSGRLVAASEDTRADLGSAGATIGEDAIEIDANLLTSNGSNTIEWVGQALAFFGEAEQISEAA